MEKIRRVEEVYCASREWLTRLAILTDLVSSVNQIHWVKWTYRLTCCNKLGLTNSTPGVAEMDKGPRGRNLLLGVRLLGVLYEVLSTVSPSSSSSSSSSSSLLWLLRLNGSWNHSTHNTVNAVPYQYFIPLILGQDTLLIVPLFTQF